MIIASLARRLRALVRLSTLAIVAIAMGLPAPFAQATDCTSCHNAQGSSSSLALPSGGFPLVSYSVNVSESLQVLLHPNDPSVKWMAAWTTPAELAKERNQPFVMLENTSTTDHGGTGSALLTTYHMTIGDTSQNFDFLKFDAKDSSPGVSLVSMQGIDTVNGGLHGDDFMLTFSGLSPGKFVIFQLDIDPDKASANPFSDYRNVLFTLNGGANTAGNSETGASFFDSTLTPADQNISLPDTPFANPVDSGPTSFGMNFTVGYMDDHVTYFGNSDTGLQNSVPEPGTFVLAALGCLGCLLIWRRGRRKMQLAPVVAK
ncbi:MAG TPA: PEP-CTERM sorting domain-containing protein [Pirellulales bacterium]|jgi:hypothetical protein